MTEVMEASGSAVTEGVSFGAEFVDNPPILARIVQDETVASTKTESGKQIMYVIKPLDFETKGAGLTTYVNLPVAKTQIVRMPDGTRKAVTGYSKRSGIYIVLEAFRRVLFSQATPEQLKDLQLGNGKMIGQVAWFKRTEVRFGVGADGSPIVASYFLPVYKATAEEIESAGYEGAVAAAEPPAPSFSDEDLHTVLEFVAGKTEAQYRRAAFRSETLPQHLKDSLAHDNAAVDALVEKGLAQRDGDGMITRVAA